MKTVYVPILKARNAEMAALSRLEPAERERITPLVELPVGVGADELVATIDRTWGEHRPFYLDIVRGRTPTQTFVPGPGVLAAIAEGCRLRGLRMIPVITPSQSPEYQHCARDLGSRNGLLLRVQTDVLTDPHALRRRVDELLMSLHLPTGLVALLIDLGFITHHSPRPVVDRMQEVLELMADLGPWRDVIFASTSFPMDLSLASRPLPNHVLSGCASRTDWNLWRTLAAAVGPGLTPLFSDYGIQHPIEARAPAQGSFPLIPLIPNIRYTTETDWLLIRGRDLHEHSEPTFRHLCQVLVKQSEFMGSSFSKGDEYLQMCADGQIATPRSYPAWREPGFIHHITLVLQCLSADGAS